MPASHSLVLRAVPRVVAILSTITLFALSGCGSDSDGVTESPSPITGGNSAPTISGNPPTSVLPGQTYTFTPAAADPNGDSLTFEILNRPGWATFDTANGRLTGTPTAAQIGSYANVTISVTDGRNRVSLPAFSIGVNAVATGRATLSWTPPTQRTDGSAVTLAGYRIYYGTSPNSFNNVISVSTAGVTTYVVDNLSSGTWYFIVSAVDSAGMESVPSNAATMTIG